MSDSNSLWVVVAEAARRFVAPLVEAEGLGPAGIARLLKQVSGSDADPPATAIDAISGLVQQISSVADGGNEASAADVLQSVDGVLLAVKSLPTALPTELPLLASQLLEFLILRFLWLNFPRTHDSLALLGVIDESQPARKRLDPAKLKHLFQPGVMMEEVYGWGTDHFDADSLLPRIANLAAAFGACVAYGRLSAKAQQVLDPEAAAAGDDPARMLFAPIFQQIVGDAMVSLGFAALPVSGGRIASDGGIAIVPVGTATYPAGKINDNWTLSFGAQGAAGVGVMLRPSGVSIGRLDSPPSGSIGTEIQATTQRVADKRWGLKLGDGFELGADNAKLAIACDLPDSPGKPSFNASFSVYGLEIVVSPQDADGFIAKVLPPEGLRGHGDVKIAWSTAAGFYLEGGVGTAVTIPLDLDAGAVTVEALGLACNLSLTGVPAINLEGTLDASFELGPIAASIARIGVTSKLEFLGDTATPSEGVTPFGPFGIGIGFRPPDGVGLAIDGVAVTGGGFLDFDDQAKQYSGIVQVDFAKIGLVAIGLITTRMPDGSKGFSMLIDIGVSFYPPFQLGMGFELEAVGGLIGVNRSANVDVLRDGIRKKTLDSILFPDDPIKNATKIVSDLRAVFPPEEGRFVIGPMARITWGLDLLQINIGIVIEVPSPVRAVVLGQIAAFIPEPEAAIVEIHLDALGVIDFAKQELTINATVYDSHILILPLYGDAAVYLSWAPPSQFLMSLGGWHPKFSPPARFADLRRLTIEMHIGNLLHLSFKMYQALTSNTLQFGTRFDLLVNLEVVRVEGAFGFDVLFYFSPFSFEASMGGGVSVTAYGKTLVAIHLDLALSGPTPWHAQGHAKFEILAWSIPVDFDRTWGDAVAAQLNAVDPRSLLEAEINKNGNWSGVVPATVLTVETLRDVQAPADKVLVHPCAALEIRQRVLPLDIQLTKFNNAPITGHDLFQLKVLTSEFAGKELLIQDQFARAQFDADISNDQKLSIPSYEPFDAGIAISTDAIKWGAAVSDQIEFEPILIDDMPKVTMARARMDSRIAGYVFASRSGGSAGIGNRKYEVPGRRPDISVNAESYAVASASDLSLDAAAGGGTFGTRTAADRALRNAGGDRQVVLSQEVAA